jgi:glycerol transport system ATP-binding protein
MTFRMEAVEYRRGRETWLYPLDLELHTGVPNVLLGATGAGKTTLMRLLAGLESPSSGRLLDGDRDITGTAVRRRSVSMVYQQFINYPSMSVFENIASPLRVAGWTEARTRERVGEIAESLHLSSLLSRLPAELSGGQQQRTALARALAREADLLLLDEPLANLDYKLREELRDELAQIFGRQRTTVVYATTEPLEALQLGGRIAVLDAGRLLQTGETSRVFARPESLAAARAFSDPPINVLPAVWRGAAGQLQLATGALLSGPDSMRSVLGSGDVPIQVGIRPQQLRLVAGGGGSALEGAVELAEISGSDTYLHIRHGESLLVAQVPGVHPMPLESRCTLHVDAASLYGFTGEGQPLFAPAS